MRNRRIGTAACVLAIVGVVCAILVMTTPQHQKSREQSPPSYFSPKLGASKKYVFDSQLPDRLQWINNSGYCGEVSTQMALMKYGSYLSEYDIREIAAIATTNAQKKHFYLVGENDERASKLLKLKAVEWDNSVADSRKYLAWCKQMVRKGHPVTITVYMNFWAFYGELDPDAGFPDYDHIVSIAKIESDYDDDEYHDDDVITMSDHGLYSPDVPGPPYPFPYEAPYYFSYTFADFQKTRQEANAIRAGIYSLPYSSRSDPLAGNFGVAHAGNLDDCSGCLLPVLVASDKNFEAPQIEEQSEERPDNMPLGLVVTVSGLEEGETYNLFRYDDEGKVPTKGFNQAAANAVSTVTFVADESGVKVFNIDILSDMKVFFRCVAADAA